MSHYQQTEFVKSVKNLLPDYFYQKNVLEFGSLNLNGSVREFFSDCCYIGVDLGKGKDVDVVSIAHEYNLPDQSFDVVLSCEMFEHDPYWNKSFSNMVRLCKSNGLIFFTCATIGRAKHGTLYCDPNSSPLTVDLGWDYYKNLTELDFKKDFNLEDLFTKYQFSVDNTCFDLYFWGVRK